MKFLIKVKEISIVVHAFVNVETRERERDSMREKWKIKIDFNPYIHRGVILTDCNMSNHVTHQL